MRREALEASYFFRADTIPNRNALHGATNTAWAEGCELLIHDISHAHQFPIVEHLFCWHNLYLRGPDKASAAAV